MFIILAIGILSACKTGTSVHKDYDTPNLKIVRIAENTFQHISYLHVAGLGKYPCNGMVYLNGNEAIIFDTPTNNSASAELIKWIGNRQVKGVVVTHFHNDCLGGLAEFHKKGIPSYASETTIALAKANQEVVPKTGFGKNMELTIGGDPVHVKFFGQGHTVDNVVGYVPSKKTLFGGCLVKQLNASKGNLEDANVKQWANTVENIIRAIPDLQLVIPGHGEPGGIGLLEYTAKLFKSN